MVGYIPVSDINGLMTWTDPAAIGFISQIADADNNTFVKTEKAPNENIIRLLADGNEIATFKSAKAGIRNNDPQFTVDINHGSGSPSPGGGNGFTLRNEVSNNRLTQYVFSSGNYTLYYNGVGRGSFDITSGAYTSVSDGRLKKNIAPPTNQMPRILKLRPTSYQFLWDKSNKPQMGLIAQEVREIYPGLAPIIESTSDGAKQDLYGVTYAGFVPVLIAGMQEQQKQIELLQQQIALLKKENESILNWLPAPVNTPIKKWYLPKTLAELDGLRNKQRPLQNLKSLGTSRPLQTLQYWIGLSALGFVHGRKSEIQSRKRSPAGAILYSEGCKPSY